MSKSDKQAQNPAKLLRKKLRLRIEPLELFSSFIAESECAFLLESCEGSSALARYSIVGFSPRGILKSMGGKAVLSQGGKSRVIGKGKLEDVLKIIPKCARSVPGFCGGAVGYVSFDYVRSLEPTLGLGRKNSSFPEFEFGLYDDAVVFDRLHGTIEYRSVGEDRSSQVLALAEKAKQLLLKPSAESANAELVASTSREKFCSMVSAAKGHISKGDAFQVVLSRRFDIRVNGSLLGFYKSLRNVNPSPYMYYLKFGRREVIGASPENLVRTEGSRISSYATLAGTRRRGITEKEDKALERELLSDEKERAEHIMLVDLTRNDVGKVSVPGTVKVENLMQVHKYSHVQHMASLVKGRLRADKNPVDAFHALFPAGTVSGAPKIRAIQILDDLEQDSREVYGGAVGYLSSNGDSDFAICIRSLFSDGKMARVQAGAGIVYDSIPEYEFIETENKAKALLHCIGINGR